MSALYIAQRAMAKLNGKGDFEGTGQWSSPEYGFFNSGVPVTLAAFGPLFSSTFRPSSTLTTTPMHATELQTWWETN